MPALSEHFKTKDSEFKFEFAMENLSLSQTNEQSAPKKKKKKKKKKAKPVINPELLGNTKYLTPKRADAGVSTLQRECGQGRCIHQRTSSSREPLKSRFAFQFTI